ncbi:primosomal protein N' [bacterium]|nr:primosomal protein N' [bacterium]
MFLYECPPEIGRLKPGDAVLVPFGGRDLLGWVIETNVEAEEPDPAKKPIRIKPIIERVEGAGLGPVEMELCERLHAWYGTNFPDILGLFVPPAAPKLTRRIERAADAPHAGQDGLSREAQTVLAELESSGGGLDVRDVTRLLNPMSPRGVKFVLTELTASGLCRLRTRVVAPRPARKKFVGPSEPVPDAPPAKSEALTDVQKKVMDIARRHPFRFGAAELADLSKATPAEIRALVASRLLAERAARHWRTPMERSESKGDGIESPAPDARKQATPSQARALAEILPAIESAGQGGPPRFLLFGPTASGKTFVYEEAARACLARGRQVLLLVPEIALTKPLIQRIVESIPEPVAVMHSRLRPAERRDEWQRCARGDARLLVGARSAAFVPLPDLGLAIIDECHDAGYKESQSPYLDARRVLEEKCDLMNAPLIIGSATPTVEQLYLAAPNRAYRRLDLTDFPTRPARPDVRVIDIRRASSRTKAEGQALLTADLLALIQQTLDRKEAAVLLLNRRGFAPQVSCPNCGYAARCEACLLGLTYHLQDRNLICHGCGASQPPPSRCPVCSYTPLGYMGVGTERVAGMLTRLFPAARIGRLDQDAFRKNRQAAFDILDDLKLGRIDILVGTQMIAKGLDVPRVTLAAVICADIGLNLPDFRSAERTFQLLSQLIGRSGRHDRPGLAAIQTFQTGSRAVLRSVTEDTAGFYEEELEFRRAGHWPPFCRLIKILVQSPGAPNALSAAREIHASLSTSQYPAPPLSLSPPLPAPRPKLNGEYRFQMILRLPPDQPVPSNLDSEVRGAARHAKVKISIEPDPITLL